MPVNTPKRMFISRQHVFTCSHQLVRGCSNALLYYYGWAWGTLLVVWTMHISEGQVFCLVNLQRTLYPLRPAQRGPLRTQTFTWNARLVILRASCSQGLRGKMWTHHLKKHLLFKARWKLRRRIFWQFLGQPFPSLISEDLCCPCDRRNSSTSVREYNNIAIPGIIEETPKSSLPMKEKVHKILGRSLHFALVKWQSIAGRCSRYTSIFQGHCLAHPCDQKTGLKVNSAPHLLALLCTLLLLPPFCLVASCCLYPQTKGKAQQNIQGASPWKQSCLLCPHLRGLWYC